MPADRCRVCVHLYGLTQFYQRDREEKRDERWATVPLFVAERRESVTMSEAQACALVDKIRARGWDGEIWIETYDGTRIDVEQPVQESGGDTRQPVIATLDDVTWYIVRPANTVNGPRWFIKIRIPGRPDEETIYAMDPLAVLQRATDLNWLQFAEKYARPGPQQPTTQSIFNRPRLRPGALPQ